MIFSFFGQKPAPLFRRLGMELIPQCAAIHADCFNIGWTESEFESFCLAASVHADCVTAGASGKLCGFAISRAVLDEAELLTIAVGKSQQGQGVGWLLLDNHLAGLNRAGVKSVFLEVADDNFAALKLYRRAGFTEIGVRKGYYPRRDGSRVSAVTMKLAFD